MPNGETQNGRRPLGTRGTLQSLGLDLVPKKRKPKTLSPMEQQQMMKQGKMEQEKRMQTLEEPPMMQSSPTLIKKKKKRLSNLAQSTYGVQS